MTTASTRPSPAVAVARLARFTRARYEPHYLLYAVVFTLALEATAALVSHPDAAWRPGAATIVRIVVVAVVLLYLRMVDEQKDLDYDREHHPDRPLVTGAVSAGELRVAMAVIAVAAIAASAALSVSSAVLIAAALGYGLALWGFERLSATVREAIMVNLVITYPVQLFIIAYVVVSAMSTGQVESRGVVAVVAVIFAGAFLQFEFARKTANEPRPGELFYSNALGAKGSAAAGLLCAIAAVVCDLILVRPWQFNLPTVAVAWIPVLLLIFPLWGAVRFLTEAEITSEEGGDEAGPAGPSYPLVPSVLFVLTLYIVLIVQALLLP